MKDYSQYFKGPSLKDAKHRGKDEIHHIKDAYDEAVNNKTDLVKAVIKIK